jgi:nucleoid-associated protein EbfC
MSMMDMLGAMGKVKEMKAKMEEIQDELARLDFVATHPDAQVSVKVNGKKEVIKVTVEPNMWIQNNPETVLHYIVVTTNMALKDAENKAKSLMAERTEGILPKIPGLDFGSLFNR